MKSLKVKGRFLMNVIDVASGEIIDRYEGNNLVVNSGKLNVCKLLGGDATGKKLTHISVGTNPTPPSLTDTAITGAFSKAIDSVAYVGNNIVQFIYSIAGTEANGITIQEAGLFNDSGVLFARKQRSPIVKTSAIALEGVWEIQIS
jgi:hypothetical protein